MPHATATKPVATGAEDNDGVVARQGGTVCRKADAVKECLEMKQNRSNQRLPNLNLLLGVRQRSA